MDYIVLLKILTNFKKKMPIICLYLLNIYLYSNKRKIEFKLLQPQLLLSHAQKHFVPKDEASCLPGTIKMILPHWNVFCKNFFFSFQLSTKNLTVCSLTWSQSHGRDLTSQKHPLYNIDPAERCLTIKQCLLFVSNLFGVFMHTLIHSSSLMQ